MKRLIFSLLLLININVYAADLVIYAAASTTSAVNEIIDEFYKISGAKAVAAYASSGTLAKQVANGAPADIFISANAKWMKWLVDKDKVHAPEPLLTNRLALIGNEKSANLDISGLGKAFVNNRFSMADPEHSPAGRYAKKALESLNIWDSSKKSATRMQTVRAALALVERNAVSYGIVYSSDVYGSKSAKILSLFDEKLHGAIRYPFAMAKRKSSTKALELYNFMKSDKGMMIFEKYGFQRAR